MVAHSLAFCLNELDSTVSVVDLTAPANRAEVSFTASTRHDIGLAAHAPSQPSALRTMPDGALITVQRGINTVSRFRVDGVRLTLADEVPTGGDHPRDAITFGSSTIVVALRMSDSVRALDLATHASEELAEVRRPTCILEEPRQQQLEAWGRSW